MILTIEIIFCNDINKVIVIIIVIIILVIIVIAVVAAVFSIQCFYQIVVGSCLLDNKFDLS